MKTEQQIKNMLSDSLDELVKIQEWEKQALKKHQENIKTYGRSDYGEVSEASQQISYRKGEIEALKWALL